jgi:2'-5' RNA ligase
MIPEGEKLNQIQNLRLKFDPLAEKVPPHITVVFPFELNWRRERLSAILDMQVMAVPIAFSLGEPTERDGYMYFPLIRGFAQVSLLHNTMYSLLPSRLLSDFPYKPHLTFGRLYPGQKDCDAMEEAAKVPPCSGVIRRMVLERIGALDESILEHEISCP